MGGNNQPYQLTAEDSRLLLMTSSFRAERGSVLHSGIYNRELTSSLASGTLVGAVFLALVMAGVEVTAAYVVPAVILFGGLFVLFRKAVFYEEQLEAVFDRAGRVITVVVRRFPKRRYTYPLDELADIREDHIVMTPENPDGISFVEKIAAQHGAAIPGFGETKEFYTVDLEFKDGRRMRVFSSREESGAGQLRMRLKEFIGGRGAQEV
jgi:hypothetical protein